MDFHSGGDEQLPFPSLRESGTTLPRVSTGWCGGRQSSPLEERLAERFAELERHPRFVDFGKSAEVACGHRFFPLRDHFGLRRSSPIPVD